MSSVKDTAKRVLSGDGRGGRRPGAGRKPKYAKIETGPEYAIEADVPIFDASKGVGTATGFERHSEPSNPIAEALVASSAALLPTMTVMDPESLYSLARAQKEAALAAKAELDYRRKAGMVVPREAVQRATATAFATVAQALRSIPDVLERKIGMPPEISERVGTVIDEVMSGLSEELERIHRDAAEQAALGDEA